MKSFRLAMSALAVVTQALATVSAARAAEAAPAQHIRGTLTKVSPDEVTVETRTGPVVVRVDHKTKIIGVVPATPAEITSGAFIGTANVPGATSTATRALEVVVFPESMAGIGEGDFAWDFPGGRSQATSMTNGTVAPRRAGTMMTNARVTGVNNGVSKSVILQYKGGSKQVTIPPDTPIVRAVPASTNLLVPGAHVFTVRATSPVPFLVVGEQGAVPPM